MEIQSETTDAATLEFESPHFLQSLFANDFSLLKVLERTFGVVVTTLIVLKRRDGRHSQSPQVRGLAA